MNLDLKIDTVLTRLVRHESDTPLELEHKVYMLRNMLIAGVLIAIIISPPLFMKLYKLYLLVGLLDVAIIIPAIMLIIIKRGVNWFLFLLYGGYIILCCFLVMKLGGLQNSFGVWGGAIICFLLAIGVKIRKLLIVNAIVYSSCLLVIAFSYPFLTVFSEWTPKINNLAFILSEIWMCLFLVKAFYDSIIVKTNEAKNKAAQLQELDILKSKLYTNVAHEFRTPLTLIKGKAEEIGEHHGEEALVQINSIVRNSNKILFLVNEMLNLSRIEEGGVAMHFVQGELVGFLRFITGNFQGFAESRKVDLHFQTQFPQLLMDIEGEKLEECISNLLSNAIRYTPGGGQVTVELKGLPGQNKQVEISVRDTGIGMPADQLEKIFIRFYRVEGKDHPYQEGSGIGLTLVNEYVKLMKGSIRVNSRPGDGSEFKITLPLSRNAEVGELVPVKGPFAYETGTEKFNPTDGEKKQNLGRLLIVEDNKELLAYLSGLLENDYEIFTAENGVEGITQAMEQIPDIILSDVMMPGKSGYELCKVLKSDIRTNHIPLVLLTARADTESRITGREQGADAYLTKPFDKRELKVCLKNLFVQREVLRQKFRSGLFNQKNPEKEQGLNEKFLDRVIASLEKNYRNDRYGISELHSDLGISRVQLHRKLVALTGLSASNFIRNFRLQKARSLLLETNENISDIAWLVGFSDANYFSKSFIQEYGLSASEWRESFI